MHSLEQGAAHLACDALLSVRVIDMQSTPDILVAQLEAFVDTALHAGYYFKLPLISGHPFCMRTKSNVM